MKTYLLPALLLSSALFLQCAKDKIVSENPAEPSNVRSICDLGTAIDIGTRSSSTVFNFTKSLDFSSDQSALVLSAIRGTELETLCTYSLTGSGYLKLQVNSSEQLVITSASSSPSDHVETYDLDDLNVVMLDNINAKVDFIGTMDVRPSFATYFQLDAGVKIKVNQTAHTIEFRY